MPTQQILRDEWRSFCDNLSRQHHGGDVTLEEFDTVSGAHIITWDLSLEGIVADLKHSNHETLAIVVSENTDRHITHLIPAPLQLSFQAAEGATAGVLNVTSANGTRVLLRFGRRKKLSEPMLQALIARRMAKNYQQKEYVYG